METDAEPDYRTVRRWCIQHHNPIRPGDLQRQYGVRYSRAATLLEELERDRVLRRQQDGSFTAWPDRARDANGRLLRDRAFLKKDRHADERCELCGWCIPVALRTKRRTSGCHDHHVIPVACGGSDAPINRLLLCPNHHQLAHTMFPVSGGVHRGPRTRDELADVLRLAELDAQAFDQERARLAVSTLTTDRPSPPPAPPPITLTATPQARPPRPLRRRLPRPTAAQLRLHINARHRGAIFDCRVCADGEPKLSEKSSEGCEGSGTHLHAVRCAE